MGPLKIISDGSLNTRTAWCEQPYADGSGTGAPNQTPDELRALMARATEHGLHTAVHAIGDAACHDALAAYAETGARGSIEHAQLMTRHDVTGWPLSASRQRAAGPPARRPRRHRADLARPRRPLLPAALDGRRRRDAGARLGRARSPRSTRGWPSPPPCTARPTTGRPGTPSRRSPRAKRSPPRSTARAPCTPACPPTSSSSTPIPLDPSRRHRGAGGADSARCPSPPPSVAGRARPRRRVRLRWLSRDGRTSSVEAPDLAFGTAAGSAHSGRWSAPAPCRGRRGGRRRSRAAGPSGSARSGGARTARRRRPRAGRGAAATSAGSRRASRRPPGAGRPAAPAPGPAGRRAPRGRRSAPAGPGAPRCRRTRPSACARSARSYDARTCSHGRAGPAMHPRSPAPRAARRAGGRGRRGPGAAPRVGHVVAVDGLQGHARDRAEHRPRLRLGDDHRGQGGRWRPARRARPPRHVVGRRAVEQVAAEPFEQPLAHPAAASPARRCGRPRWPRTARRCRRTPARRSAASVSAGDAGRAPRCADISRHATRAPMR